MKKIIIRLTLFLLTVSLLGCSNSGNLNENAEINNVQNTERDQQGKNGQQFTNIYSGPGEDYYIEGKQKKVKAFREFKDWYEVEYSGEKRGYVKKDELNDIDVSKVELVVNKRTVGPTERTEIVELDEEFSLTNQIELREAPNDKSNVFGTVSKNEKVEIINLEPVKDNSSSLESLERLRYWQVDAQTANGRVRGYVRNDDLFDYDNPLRGFEDVKENNAKISYDGNDYFSTTGAIIDGYLDNWHLEKSFTVSDKNFGSDFVGGLAGILGIDYNPETVLVQKTMEMPTVTKGKKNYHHTTVAVDVSNEKLLNRLTWTGAIGDWVPAFCRGAANSGMYIDVELQEYNNEHKVVLRMEKPFELQNDASATGKTFELSDMLVNAKGSAVGTREEVDKMIRSTYPQLKGDKKYSMKITFADSAACKENPYGYYVIIDKDLNVYTQMIIHTGTQAVVYYDNKPVYDATNDLASLQQLDDVTSKRIIDLLQKNGFTFTTVESVAGEEQHANAAQIVSDLNNDEIIEKYKAFIQTQTNAVGYLIYDIEKDGYPEVFINEINPEEREAHCDIYFYSDEGFKLLDRTYGPGFWHVLPTYASYPDGSGLVEHGAVKGKEYVSIETWNEGENYSETVYQGDYYSIDDIKYYKNSLDLQQYECFNHQYYQNETSSPYFEGSYLLAQSATDNFTALYEAFNVSGEQQGSNEVSKDSDAEEKWMLVKTVLEGVDGNKVGLSQSSEIVTEYIYDENHNCIEEKESYDGGTPGTTTTYGYDEAGHMISMETPTGGPYYYAYNELGQEIQRDDGAESYITSYDDHGNISRYECYRGGEMFHFMSYSYEYDNEGNAVVKKCFDEDGIVWVQNCKYDDNNNLTMEEHFAGGDQYSWMRAYVYDESSHKTVETEYSSDNIMVRHLTFEYDQYGNLIKENDIREDKLYSVKTYYYEKY